MLVLVINFHWKGCCSGLLSLAYYAGIMIIRLLQNSRWKCRIPMYVLDNSIAELLELIDRKVGLNNTLFFA